MSSITEVEKQSYLKSAEATFELYNAHVIAGFTKEQALQITLRMIVAMLPPPEKKGISNIVDLFNNGGMS